MQFLSVIIRSDTRIRLEFSSPLDASAFTGSGTITITSQDGLGLSPVVNQRLPVVGNTQAMELVLSIPLVEGAQYLLELTDIPGADVTTADGSEFIRSGSGFTKLNVEINNPDIEAAIYNVDLVWTGADYLETPDGDLATITGSANVHGALTRRLVADGLPWDSDYGTKSRSFVDGPTPATSVLRGEIMRQMLSDNRVKKATVRLELPENEFDEADYFVDIELVGASNTSNLTISAPK